MSTQLSTRIRVVQIKRETAYEHKTWYLFHGLTDDYDIEKFIGYSKCPIVEGGYYDIVATQEPNDYRDGFTHQYRIQRVSSCVKLSKEATEKYLSSATFKGIGPVCAKLIVDEFGEDSLTVIEKHPEKLKDLGLSEKQIFTLSRGVSSNALEDKLRKLSPGISDNTIMKIADYYCEECDMESEQVVSLIKTDTYKLLYDIDSLGFKDVDAIALDVGMPLYDKRRINECYKYSLHRYVMDKKQVYLDTGDAAAYNEFYANVLACAGSHDLVQYANTLMYSSTCVSAVQALFMNPNSIQGIQTVLKDDGHYAVYKTDVLKQETGISRMLADAMCDKSLFMRLTNCTLDDIEDDIAAYEKKYRKQLDPSQKLAVTSSLMSSVSIINGGPGRGKTCVVDCVLYIWSKHMRSDEKEPVLSAPTGRAVTVLKNATGNNYDVQTAMRRIWSHKLASEETLAQMHNNYTQNLVVLDECSMVGMCTAYEFLCLFEDCQFIFVGDVDQLPSIEYGQFFKDLCDSSVIMKSTLTVNHRAKGGLIIDNADAMNSGDIASIDFDSDTSQFQLIRTANNCFSDKILDEYKQWVYNNGSIDMDKVKSITVLCPSSKNETGCNNLNMLIQNIVNPQNDNAKANERGYVINSTHMYIDDRVKDLKLRVGDRVMQTKNRYDATVHVGHGKKATTQMGIFNGETGIIKCFYPAAGPHDTDSLLLEFDDGRTTVIEEEYMKELTLAYAMTIHKAQGSEYDMVLLILQPCLNLYNPNFATRNLLYTGVTRAKFHVKLLGYYEALCNCIMTAQPARNSMLSSRIQMEYKQIMEQKKLNNYKKGV